MSENVLARIRRNVARTLSYRIGSHSVSPTQKDDFRCICNGLTLWGGILLDNGLRFGLNDQQYRGYQGRVITLPWLRGDREVDLTSLLVLLDELDSFLLEELSSSNRFKGDFLKRIGIPAYAGVLLSLCRWGVKALLEGRRSDDRVAADLHQTFCFLKKMQLDRPDLRESAEVAFLEFEALLSERQARGFSPYAIQAIYEMNQLARIHLADFTVSPLRPRHGPGAVADKGVKCFYDKYLHMNSDARIDYLLGRNGLGTTMDYCPWVKPEKSTRTSRFISVPKTWKKLRGISAEPVELQFFQQGIAGRLDELFSSDPWWRQRVDLHDQGHSRRLALLGSIHDGYATIDLSAASDSVTLELVKAVFKGTRVLPWLLGTRSTYTLCDEHRVRLHKFAPMGSACCFPVECIVFALAAQVASDRTALIGLGERQTVRVYGDDIIVDSHSAPELIRILEELGFEVNTSKSYISGGFREACGVEAYRGKEIQPLRYKRLSWLPEPGPAGIGDIATALSYCNQLYERGYRITRAYLLDVLLRKQYRMGKARREVGRYLAVTHDGQRGTLASPLPTNFNLVKKLDRQLQTLVVRSIGFRLRLRSQIPSSEMSELYSWFKYHEWQLEHQSSLRDWERTWEKGWIDLGHVSDFDQRLPLGFTMTPSEKWVVWTHSNSLMSPTS